VAVAPEWDRRAAGGRRHRWPGAGLADQRSNELIFPHGVPASHAVLLRKAGKIPNWFFLEAG
jgi:hypothetical protein